MVITRDTVLTVMMGEWALKTDMWDGETLSGPVARLFAASPEAATKAMKEHLGSAFKDLNRINGKVYMSENIQATEAFGTFKNPR